MGVKERVAIVTGAASGIGECIAGKLAENGAKVVAFDLDGEGVAKIVKKIKDGGGEAAAVQGDVTREEDVQRMASTAVEKYGRIDILVNSAGVTRDNLITQEFSFFNLPYME